MLPSKIYIDHLVSGYPEVEHIVSHFNISPVVVDDIFSHIHVDHSDIKKISEGKNLLYLTRNKGAFIRGCPGTKYYNCCGYRILHIGTFCNLDCSYCILQAYFHPPLLQFFVNHRDLIAELKILFQQKQISRIGTGEFTDSMIWEEMFNLSDLLVPEFSRQNRSVLELKTKTSNIQRLKELDHHRKTIAAWSVNTETIIQTEEKNTTSLNERLACASQCETWGYPVAFHFDPMIIYDGCEKDYIDVIERIFKNVSSKNIVWISMGTFRFMPALKPIIQERFHDSTIVYGEFINGIDGKMRYFKPLRINLYKKMISCIRDIAPNVLVYFCMEDDDVWRKSMGFVPSEKGGLPRMLDESAINICGLDKHLLG